MEEGEDNARVKNRQVAKAAAQVLELESAGELCFALTTLRTETRGKPFNLVVELEEVVSKTSEYSTTVLSGRGGGGGKLCHKFSRVAKL